MTHDTAQERSALFVAVLTSFMGPFMISAVNVALPAIQAEMNVNAVALSWISTAYLLAMAVVLLPAGRLADIYGRKKVFSAGLVLYTVASVLVALVPNIAWMLALRVLQGFGAAMFVTTGMAILTSIFPPQRRGRAIGLYVSAVYIGLSVGPFAGGILTQHAGWRSLFLLMLPLGCGSVWVTLRLLKGEWADARGEPFDVIGSLLYGAAIFTLVFGATRLPAIHAWGLLAFGASGLILFAWHAKRTRHPVFDVTLFQTNRTFVFSSLAALINYAATFAVTFLLSLFLQYIKGLPPQTAGMLLVTQPAVMAIFSPIAGRFADRIEPRLIASAGMLITVWGLAGFILLSPEASLVLIVGNLMLTGFGFALFSSPNMSAIMGSVDKRHYGIASGTVAAMRLMGQMTSMAVATVVISLFMGDTPIVPARFPQFLESIRMIFSILTLLSLAGLYFSMSRGRLHPNAKVK
jgi:EmrB/QacA subfamily drug resistance transporter